MNIQLLSDLHLECQPHWQPTPAVGADVLVLAGDIGSYQSSSQLQEDDFGLTRFSPLHGWPTPVIFVPGNHEYDGLDFDAAHARLRTTCDRLGLIWLEREVLHWPGKANEVPLRFIGTTLWTDFDALTPRATTVHTPQAQLLAAQLKARSKAFRAADYYLAKTGTTRHGEPWLAAQVREQGLLCQQWLTDALAEPFDGRTLVVTHFAPSLHSADPRYGRAPGTAGFCNALDHLLPQANLWLHGHLHAPSHYTHEGCRVVANPMGYARKNEQAHFDPVLCLSV
ncbi:MAG: metallophosphoesterase [Rhodoferax sp.]|uniref:metallophosphoesterase n=1 Tax=Rhodoferax sp. TaxID=50421 RepID=UPI0026272B6B|nr:metallophosphoesterase [Rhodoferax sp.]MDD2881853.1 metallophosphoesterase [Rhodoferax sp.]